jgi:N-acetylneuraminate synthase
MIAEAGVNHNGDPARALTMVDAAAAVGADAFKIQTFSAEALASEQAAKAPYQAAAIGEDGDQRCMLKNLELSADAHEALRERCQAHGIEFLSTPFDLASLRFLVDKIGIARIKLGSSEVTHGPMLVAAGSTGLPVILSTGMSTLDEVAIALGALAFGYLGCHGRPSIEDFRALARAEEGRRTLVGKVTLMQCTTAYPAPPAEANLRAMATMSDTFGLPIGYSDHTLGTVTAVAAVALGAVVIEKHFTLDRGLPGPDHRASLELPELKTLVDAVRETEIAIGDGIKRPTPSETANLAAARRSLVVSRAIRRGERFHETNLTAKRPGTGISPMEHWAWLGRTASRDYNADELVEP